MAGAFARLCALRECHDIEVHGTVQGLVCPGSFQPSIQEVCVAA